MHQLQLVQRRPAHETPGDARPAAGRARAQLRFDITELHRGEALHACMQRMDALILMM